MQYTHLSSTLNENGYQKQDMMATKIKPVFSILLSQFIYFLLITSNIF